MEQLARAIQQELEAVTPEAFMGINEQEQVVYPYLTYTIGGNGINGNQEENPIEVNLFDYGTSHLKILELEGRIRDHFQQRKIMTPDLFIQFSVGLSTEVPTGDRRIKRRDLTIYTKTDWRNKEWQNRI